MTALLTENLPLLAGAPNGVKKLRELILELAVRGKLVPQDQSDEPASALLKRIVEEKARLTVEGKIRKPKPLAEIAEEEKLFDIPASWEWVRVAAVGHDWGQKTPDQDFTYIDVGSIDNLAGVVRDPQVVAAAAASSRARKIVKPGTIIYSTIRPYLLNITVIDRPYQPEPIASTAFAIVHPVCGMSSRYFFWYFRSPLFVAYVESVQMGIAYPAINDGQFFNGIIPLPPLAEQHRIVAKVDELMALCDRLETQQADAQNAHVHLVRALLDSLIQANNATDFTISWRLLAEHFHTLFTTESSIDALKQTLLQLAVMGKLVPQYSSDEPASALIKSIDIEMQRLIAEGKLKKPKPVATVTDDEKLYELPLGWEWVRLETIAQVGTGATPLRSNPKYFQPSTINWVTSGETSQGFIRETEQKVSPLALTETNLTVYPPHTLIIAMYGQGKTRGQISELLIEACTNQACSAIQLFEQSDSHRRYVKNFFIKSYDEIRLLAAGGAQPNLNLGKIKESIIPLPPLQEQSRIVAKVDQLISLCDQLKNNLSQAHQISEQLATTLIEQAVA
jgi:type I restriction enzyme S subunit